MQSPLYTVLGLAKYAQISMTVLGIVIKFFQIVISVFMSMAVSCIPLVWYSIGSGRKTLLPAFTRLFICATIAGAVALLIVELFPLPLIEILDAANQSAYCADLAVKCFRTYLCIEEDPQPKHTVNGNAVLLEFSLYTAESYRFLTNRSSL